jgi:hypothetical protein
MATIDSGSRWILVGRVAVVVTIIGTLVGLYSALFPPAPRLTAQCLIDEIDRDIDLDDLVSPEDLMTDDAKVLASRLSEVGLVALQEFDDLIIESAKRAAEAAVMQHGLTHQPNVRCRITNDGSRTATELELVTTAAIVKAVRDGETVRMRDLSASSGDHSAIALYEPLQEGRDVLSLGDLRPDMAMELKLWTSASHFSRSDSLMFNHDAGLVELEKSHRRPFTEESSFDVLALAPLLTVVGAGVIMAVISLAIKEIKSARRPDGN